MRICNFLSLNVIIYKEPSQSLKARNWGHLDVSKKKNHFFLTMSLAHLPVELLEWITSVLSAIDLCHLWQSGDRLLHTKLKKGGVKRTELEWTHAAWIPWPSALFSSISNLENILWHSRDFDNLCPSLNLKFLPPTLKCLQLYIVDVYYVLRRSQVNMSEAFPLLETLYLSGTDMTEENLKNFPTNLKRLHLASQQSNICSSTIFRDLPRSIEDLGLICDIEDEAETGNDLPPDLQSLRISRLSASYDWLVKLPKSVKKLSISGLEQSSWSNLPSELEELTLYLPTTLPTACLSKLHHLKVLDVNFDSPLSDDDVALLPKSLTKFCSTQSRFTHLALQRIHPNLKDFEAPVSATDAAIISLFPAESIHIRLKEGCFASQLFPIDFPPSVTSLELDFINDDICVKLPATLRTLRVARGQLTSKGVSHLPSALFFFAAGISLFDDNQTLSHLSFIPFLELDLDCDPKETGVTSEWLSFLAPNPLPISDPLLVEKKTFAQKIEYLTVFRRGQMNTNWRFEPLFQSLPNFSSITHLDIEFDPATLSPAWLRFIPENVVWLKIGTFLSLPTPQEVSTLPKRLRSLELLVQQVYIKGWPLEIIQSLPRTLSELRINGIFAVSVDNNINDMAPPYLLELLEYWSPSQHFVPPLKRLYHEMQASSFEEM